MANVGKSEILIVFIYVDKIAQFYKKVKGIFYQLLPRNKECVISAEIVADFYGVVIGDELFTKIRKII